MPFLCGHCLERALLFHETPHERADDLVSVAERNALRDEIVGGIGRKQQAGRGRLP